MTLHKTIAKNVFCVVQQVNFLAREGGGQGSYDWHVD